MVKAPTIPSRHPGSKPGNPVLSPNTPDAYLVYFCTQMSKISYKSPILFIHVVNHAMCVRPPKESIQTRLVSKTYLFICFHGREKSTQSPHSQYSANKQLCLADSSESPRSRSEDLAPPRHPKAPPKPLDAPQMSPQKRGCPKYSRRACIYNNGDAPQDVQIPTPRQRSPRDS